MGGSQNATVLTYNSVSTVVSHIPRTKQRGRLPCSPLFPSSSNTPREWITSQHNITTTATPHQYIHMLHTHDSLYRDHLLVSHIVHVPSLTTLQSTCSHTSLYQHPESKEPPPKTLRSQEPKDHNPNWGQKPLPTLPTSSLQVRLKWL